MAKRNPEIKVVEYVHSAQTGELINVSDLTPEQYKKFSLWVKCTLLNTKFEGTAEFFAPGIIEPSPAAQRGIPLE